ncbi:hypothetical protein ACU4GR_29375 [Methylobacterium oryzae CBMB20]
MLLNVVAHLAVFGSSRTTGPVLIRSLSAGRIGRFCRSADPAGLEPGRAAEIIGKILERLVPAYTEGGRGGAPCR